MFAPYQTAVLLVNEAAEHAANRDMGHAREPNKVMCVSAYIGCMQMKLHFCDCTSTASGFLLHLKIYFWLYLLKTRMADTKGPIADFGDSMPGLHLP